MINNDDLHAAGLTSIDLGAKNLALVNDAYDNAIDAVKDITSDNMRLYADWKLTDVAADIADRLEITTDPLIQRYFDYEKYGNDLLNDQLVQYDHGYIYWIDQ